jgi:predicted O-methyltransferase YrrM
VIATLPRPSPRRDWRRLTRTAQGILQFGYGSFRLARHAIVQRGAAQRTWELMALIDAVRRLRPRVVLEIGTKHGGTLYCWAKVAAPDARLLSVDLPSGPFGGGYEEAQVALFESFLRTGQALKCFRQDSHAPATDAAVEEYLGGRPVDFLFIDGDHTYQGVSLDFAMYAVRVRPGGLIAFHDIVPPPVPDGNEVASFWGELKQRYEVTEFVAPDAERYGMGIGLLRWPGQFAPADCDGAEGFADRARRERGWGC